MEEAKVVFTAIDTRVEKYGHPLSYESERKGAARYSGLFIGEVNLETKEELKVSSLLKCTLAELCKNDPGLVYKKPIQRMSPEDEEPRLIKYEMYFFIYENKDHPYYKPAIEKTYALDDTVKVCLSYVIDDIAGEIFADIVMDVRLEDYGDGLIDLVRTIDECPNAVEELRNSRVMISEEYDKSDPFDCLENHLIEDGFDSCDKTGEHFLIDGDCLNTSNLVSMKVIEIVKKGDECKNA